MNQAKKAVGGTAWFSQLPVIIKHFLQKQIVYNTFLSFKDLNRINLMHGALKKYI